MQTTPPTVIASAPNAGGPAFDEEDRCRAISVAMSCGDRRGGRPDDTDDARRDRNKQESEHHDHQRSNKVREWADVCAGNRLECRKRNISTISTRLPPITTLGGRSCSTRERTAVPALAAPFLKPCVRALTMVGSVRISVIRPEQATAGAHGPHVRAPQV